MLSTTSKPTPQSTKTAIWVEKLLYLGDKFYLTIIVLEVVNYGLKGSFPSGERKVL